MCKVSRYLLLVVLSNAALIFGCGGGNVPPDPLGAFTM